MTVSRLACFTRCRIGADASVRTLRSRRRMKGFRPALWYRERSPLGRLRRASHTIGERQLPSKRDIRIDAIERHGVVDIGPRLHGGAQRGISPIRSRAPPRAQLDVEVPVSFDYVANLPYANATGRRFNQSDFEEAGIEALAAWLLDAERIGPREETDVGQARRLRPRSATRMLPQPAGSDGSWPGHSWPSHYDHSTSNSSTGRSGKGRHMRILTKAVVGTLALVALTAPATAKHFHHRHDCGWGKHHHLRC